MMFWQEVNRRDKDLITKIYQIIIIVKTKCWEKNFENSTPQWDRISKNIRQVWKQGLSSQGNIDH